MNCEIEEASVQMAILKEENKLDMERYTGIDNIISEIPVK